MEPSKKSQAFFIDFSIAVLILVVIFVVYFTYTKNLSNQDSGSLDDLLTDAKTISSSLTHGGYPNNWDVNNVVRIGFTDDGNVINKPKFNEFTKINYNKTKRLLGTTHEYFLFFENESGDVKNVEGFCGTGDALVNITYDIRAAYYYKGGGTASEENLKSFMKETFHADVYCEDSTDCPEEAGDFAAFIGNIDNYDFIVIEHPVWTGNQWNNNFEPVATPWLQRGGILFVGGNLPKPNQVNAFGVIFYKESGTAPKNEVATVIREDEFITFNIGDKITFNQAYYVKNEVATGFIDIARFDNIIKYGENAIAIARWPVGTNGGRVLFFSDFQATYLAGDFQEILEGSAKKWANAVCLPIDISNIKREKLVRIDRLLVYNSKIIKMVLYIWS